MLKTTNMSETINFNMPAQQLLSGYGIRKYNGIQLLSNNKKQTNLTKLCASFGKSYDDWYNKHENQEFISRLRSVYNAKGKNPKDVVTTFITTSDPSHDGVYGCTQLYVKIHLAVSQEFRDKCKTVFMPIITAYREHTKKIEDRR